MPVSPSSDVTIHISGSFTERRTRSFCGRPRGGVSKKLQRILSNLQLVVPRDDFFILDQNAGTFRCAMRATESEDDTSFPAYTPIAEKMANVSESQMDQWGLERVDVDIERHNGHQEDVVRYPAGLHMRLLRGCPSLLVRSSDIQGVYTPLPYKIVDGVLGLDGDTSTRHDDSCVETPAPPSSPPASRPVLEAQRAKRQATAFDQATVAHCGDVPMGKRRCLSARPGSDDAESSQSDSFWDDLLSPPSPGVPIGFSPICARNTGYFGSPPSPTSGGDERSGTRALSPGPPRNPPRTRSIFGSPLQPCISAFAPSSAFGTISAVSASVESLSPASGPIHSAGGALTPVGTSSASGPTSSTRSVFESICSAACTSVPLIPRNFALGPTNSVFATSSLSPPVEDSLAINALVDAIEQDAPSSSTASAEPQTVTVPATRLASSSSPPRTKRRPVAADFFDDESRQETSSAELPSPQETASLVGDAACETTLNARESVSTLEEDDVVLAPISLPGAGVVVAPAIITTERDLPMPDTNQGPDMAAQLLAVAASLQAVLTRDREARQELSDLRGENAELRRTLGKMSVHLSEVELDLVRFKMHILYGSD